MFETITANLMGATVFIILYYSLYLIILYITIKIKKKIKQIRGEPARRAQ